MRLLYHVESLRGRIAERPGGRQAAVVDGASLREVLGAPWREVSLVELGPSATLGPKLLPESEAFLFVTAGARPARFAAGDSELDPGTALTLLKGGALNVDKTGAGPLELFLAETGVAQ